MKKLLASSFSVAAGVALLSAATSPLYVNNSPVTVADIPPQIDALAFLNRSTFEVFTALPFQGQHVLFWTNNGFMSGSPGYRFENDTSGRTTVRIGGRLVRVNSKNLQLPSADFFNDGNIAATTTLTVNSTNIYSPGRLDGSEASKINLLALNGLADLTRGGVRVGPATGAGALCSGINVGNTFFSDSAIVDTYWGAGRNDDLGTNGRPLNLPSLTTGFGIPSYDLPFPRSPSHQVLRKFTGSSLVFTSFASLPSFGCSGGYAVHVHTNFNNATSMVYTVVFVPTNSLLAPDNLFMDVRFTPDSGRWGNAYAPVVEFRSVDFDIVDQQLATNYFTFIDTSAAQTNITLSRATAAAGTRLVSTRRPSSYTWIRGRYCSFDFSDTANVLTYDPSVFYSPAFASNQANTLYAANSINVGAANTQTILAQPLGFNPSLTDPTNFDGTVTINASKLNLANSRIRAQDFIGIHTANLISNSFAQLDAPFVDFDVRSTNSSLLISNVAPSSVNRIFGNISAYSSVWTAGVTNTDSGQLHTVRFHVLIIDNCLQSAQPVTMNRFFVSAPNLQVADNVSVNSGLKLDARTFTIERSGSLSLPLGANLAFTNVQNLLNFTNRGALTVPAAAFFGDFQAGHSNPNNVPRYLLRRKKPKTIPPLDTFVDEGSIVASSIFVRATNAMVKGSGLIGANRAVLAANGGVVGITASGLTVADAQISATSDTEFRGRTLNFSNSVISAGLTNVRGALVIDATNALSDGGLASSNSWLVNNGARMSVRPANPGDLMGTHLTSRANAFAQSIHRWAGENRGVSPGGFTNNLALGRLTLDGAQGTTFRFQGVATGQALYVEYLELLNFPSVYFESSALSIDSGFTIYFADSNVRPDRLDGIFGGRVRWVNSYAGPRSSTNIVYPNGVTYTFNSALCQNPDLDSDGDGIENAIDCTPIIPPGLEGQPEFWFGSLCPAPDAGKSQSVSDVPLRIKRVSGGREVTLSWDAAAGSVNTLEYAESLGAGSWQTLTNFINGPVDARVTVRDAVGAPLRVYRVRVDAGKP